MQQMARMAAPVLAALAMAGGACAKPAFPGAVGWAAETPGGRGGRIVRVTTLAADGPGSLRAALDAKGPRIIVFEVGGVIDLGRTVLTIVEPYVTIAGQTAPSPGVTLIRGGIDIKTHDVVMRHIRVRTGVDGQALRSGWEADALSSVAGHDIIVDHCSFLWALDENMSASGPRFTGKTPAEWRAGTSHRITFSYNIAGEGIANGSHPKGEHSKGSLIHDNATEILLYRNLYAHNYERNPLLKGGAQVAMANNFIYDPGQRAVQYNLMELEWEGQAYQTGELSAVGNVLRGGVSTEPLAFLMIGGVGDLRYHMRDNIAVDRIGAPLPMLGRYATGGAKMIASATPVSWPAGLAVIPATDVETHVLTRAGARPWDRDADDSRLVFDVAEGRGEIIDDEKAVGGYPAVTAATRLRFDPAAWDLETMEPKSGLYPGQKPGGRDIASPQGKRVG
nr:pectate lyase [Sphingomonas montana]